MLSSSSLPRILHNMFYPPVYLSSLLSSAHCEFFACMYVCISFYLSGYLCCNLVLCICIYRSCSCFLFLWFQPVSGFLFLPCKSGSCIFIFLCLLVFSVLSLCSLSQYQSCLVYCVWLLCFCIVVLTFWFRPYFCVLTDYSPDSWLLSCLYLDYDLCIFILPCERSDIYNLSVTWIWHILPCFKGQKTPYKNISTF